MQKKLVRGNKSTGQEKKISAV